MQTRATAASAQAEDPDEAGREFQLGDGDFERVRQLIYGRAGIALTPAKRSMVYSRLARRLRALGDSSFAQYLRRLDDPAAEEWQLFVNALTTNLTSFYREAHHFPILADHLRAQGGKGRLKIWCCAASTGEEPYTLAFTAIEAFRSIEPPVEIVATDIDTQVLERARRGVYSAESVESLPRERLSRFFRRGVGANAGRVRVRPEVAKLVTFKQLNLLEPQWPVGDGFAAIFCRNVMIYFDRPTQARILRRMAPRLVPGGLLFAGHSENLAYARDLVEPLGKTVYRLVGAAPGGAG